MTEPELQAIVDGIGPVIADVIAKAIKQTNATRDQKIAALEHEIELLKARRV